MICQARWRNGNACTHAAKHYHRTESGTLVQVCGSHLRQLKKRERLGSDEEQLQEWGVVDVPTPSPGQTTQVGEIDPSPPV